MTSVGGQGKRIINLVCPCLSASKIVPLLAWDEERLDLGSIARAFGIEPWSLKLNGHFISRGADLVASSVTWRSLLSFFSSRGLSTGATQADALVVTGRPGTKRVQEQIVAEDGMSCFPSSSSNMRLQLDDIGKIKNKKPRKSSSEHYELDQKRKQQLEDLSPLKRLRSKEADSGSMAEKVGRSRTIKDHISTCSFTGDCSK